MLFDDERLTSFERGPSHSAGAFSCKGATPSENQGALPPHRAPQTHANIAAKLESSGGMAGRHRNARRSARGSGPEPLKTFGP